MAILGLKAYLIDKLIPDKVNQSGNDVTMSIVTGV